MRDIIARFEPHVYVVDDDEAIRSVFARMCAGLATVHTFASAADFLDAYRPSSCECLLTDMHMPGMTGLALQKILAVRHPNLPVIIITGRENVGLALDAVQSGVFEFIEKTCRPSHLKKRIKDALAKSMMLNLVERKVQELEARYKRISPREIEVLERVLDGVGNKNIAHALEISEKTVEVHRNNIKNKLNAASFGEVFAIVAFLRTPHKDYIAVLEKIDINEEIRSVQKNCENPAQQIRCYNVLSDLTKDDDLENSTLYRKVEIITKLIELKENCEFSKDNFCPARRILTDINVI